mmetsp:Transcript_1000/g.1945  ORF Transcript_1000/g.1945 Transcript_1000/m.1945 type:complete len:194 (-) Transcript_1000:154-735(-)
MRPPTAAMGHLELGSGQEESNTNNKMPPPPANQYPAPMMDQIGAAAPYGAPAHQPGAPPAGAYPFSAFHNAPSVPPPAVPVQNQLVSAQAPLPPQQQAQTSEGNITANDSDVLFSGKGHGKRPGNQYWIGLVSGRVEEYYVPNLSLAERRSIARSIVLSVQQNGGRPFLTEDEHGKCYEMRASEAILKRPWKN